MRPSPLALALGLVLATEGAALAADPPAPVAPTAKPAPPRPVTPPLSKPNPPGADAAPLPSDAAPMPGPGSPGGVIAPGEIEASPGNPDATPDPAPVPPTEPVPAEPEPEPAPSGKPSSPLADAGPTPVILARDTLGGHIVVGAAASLLLPFGSLQEGRSQSELMDPGLGLRLDVGFGVSRTVMLGLYGELGMPAGDSEWAGGKAQTIAVGPFVRYHLVQGVRFDPWIGFGAGFRRTSRGDEAYTGIDFARLQVGGDYYGFSNVGIGPIVELAMGTFTSADGVTLGNKSLNANLTVGLRLVFDGPGK